MSNATLPAGSSNTCTSSRQVLVLYCADSNNLRGSSSAWRNATFTLLFVAFSLFPFYANAGGIGGCSASSYEQQAEGDYTFYAEPGTFCAMFFPNGENTFIGYFENQNWSWNNPVELGWEDLPYTSGTYKVVAHTGDIDDQFALDCVFGAENYDHCSSLADTSEGSFFSLGGISFFNQAFNPFTAFGSAIENVSVSVLSYIIIILAILISLLALGFGMRFLYMQAVMERYQKGLMQGRMEELHHNFDRFMKESEENTKEIRRMLK